MNSNQPNSDDNIPDSDRTSNSLPPLSSADDASLFSRGTTSAPKRDSELKQIGPFQIISMIAEGGMGAVYFAQQEHPVRRTVALKVIKAGRDSQQIVTRFEAERQALALMDHPNIARILDAGAAEDGSPWFAMEFVDGIPLTDYCDQNFLSIKERLALFIPVCKAVQHAHQKGILHRDLKPSNVLVATYDGIPVPKVIDFGLAKALESENRLTDKTMFTEYGAVVGTIQYMSPEQAQLDGLDIDTRTDIYSLGVILYELLTGSTPLDRQTLGQNALLKILEMIREVDPPTPSSRLSSSDHKQVSKVTSVRQIQPSRLRHILHGELDWIVMKALEKQRSRRYESATSFAEDILRFLNHEPVEAKPPSGVYRLRKFARKNLGIVVAASLLMFSLAAGIIGTSWGMLLANRRAENERVAKETAKEAEASALVARDNEKEAKEKAEKLLSQVNNHVAILGGIFTDLDIRAAKEDNRPVEAVIADRLVLAADQLVDQSVGDPVSVARLQHTLGHSLVALGRANKSVKLLEHAVETLKAQLGERDRETLEVMDKLGHAYMECENLQLAESLFNETLEICTREFAADDAQLLQTLNSLGILHLTQQNYDAAESCFQRALEAHNRSDDKDNPARLQVMANLGSVWSRQNKQEAARDILLEVVQQRKELLEPNHPDTLSAMNTLASIYQIMRQFDQAIPLHEDILKKRRFRLGITHRNTLITMSNLASAYTAVANFDRALELLDETLRIKEIQFGQFHSSTLTTLNNLADTYAAMRNLEKCIPLFEELVDRAEQNEEAKQQRWLYARKLADAYNYVGDTDKALSLLTQKLDEAQMTLPNEDPMVLSLRDSLGRTYSKAGKFDLAIPVIQKNLEIRIKESGENSKATIACMNDLGMSYYRQQDYDNALHWFEQVLALRKATMKPDETPVLLAMENVAAMYSEKEQFSIALPLQNEAYQQKLLKFGPDHIQTLPSAVKLIGLYRNVDQVENAIELGEKILPKLMQLPDADPTSIAGKINLGNAYLDSKQTERGSSLLAEVAKTAKKTMTWTDPKVFTLFQDLHNQYRAAGQLLDAQEFAEDLLVFQRQRFQATGQSTELIETLETTGQQWLEIGKPARAAQLLTESLSIRQKTEPEEWTTFTTQFRLGLALLTADDLLESEKNLQAAIEGLRDRADHFQESEQGNIKTLLESLVEKCKQLEKPELGAKWQLVLDALDGGRSP